MTEQEHIDARDKAKAKALKALNDKDWAAYNKARGEVRQHTIELRKLEHAGRLASDE